MARNITANAKINAPDYSGLLERVGLEIRHTILKGTGRITMVPAFDARI